MAGNFNPVALMDMFIEGGFSEKQAKTLSLALVQIMDSHLVTRDYFDLRLTELKAEFKGDIATVEISVARLRADLIQWMVTILIVQTGATAVLFKLLN